MSGAEWDVIVVGASLAGLAAVRAALNKDLSVMILEQSQKTKKVLGSGVVGLETGRYIEEKFKFPISDCLHAVPYLKGVKFHLGHGAPIARPFSLPAYHIDREKLINRMLFSMKDTPAMFRSKVTSVAVHDDHSEVVAIRDKQDWTFKGRALINASGSQILGLPTEDNRTHWKGSVLPATQFVARAALHGELPDPGWHEVLLSKNFIAFFRSVGGKIHVEMTLPSARKWPQCWREFLGYLTGPMETQVFEEDAASFSWESRMTRWQLGQEKVLNAGDAAGLWSVLGYGIRSAVQSGLAAGRASEFVGHTPDALTVYKKGLEDLKEEVEGEWSTNALKKGLWIVGPDKMTFRDLVKDLSPWKRWKILKEAHSRLNLFIKPNPSRAQLPDRTR